MHKLVCFAICLFVVMLHLSYKHVHNLITEDSVFDSVSVDSSFTFSQQLLFQLSNIPCKVYNI